MAAAVRANVEDSHESTGVEGSSEYGAAGRQSFCDYIDRIREAGQGLNPTIRPEWNALAGLRDLANALLGQGSQAQTGAGPEN